MQNKGTALRGPREQDSINDVGKTSDTGSTMQGSSFLTILMHLQHCINGTFRKSETFD